MMSKLIVRLALACALAFVLVPGVSAQAPPTSDKTFLPAAEAALTKLNANSPEPWMVKWSAETGLPFQMSGQTNKKYQGNVLEIARQFLEEYRPLFTGLSRKEDPGYTTFDVKPGTPISSDLRRIIVPQRYKGAPVYRTAASFGIDNEGHVVWVGGNPYPVKNLKMTPPISADSILGYLREAVKPDSLGNCSRPELIVYRATPPFLAYRVNGMVWNGNKSGSGEYVLDARTGKVLHPFIDQMGLRGGR